MSLSIERVLLRLMFRQLVMKSVCLRALTSNGQDQFMTTGFLKIRQFTGEQNIFQKISFMMMLAEVTYGH